MKRAVSLLLTAILFLSLFPGCERKKKIPPDAIRSVTHFYYTESHGSDFDRRITYEFNAEDGVYTVIIKLAGVTEEDALTANVGSAFAEQLETVLRDYDVGSWNGFDKKDYHYIEGEGFTLHAVMADGTDIDAVGLMEWPEHYDAVSQAFHKLFMGIYQEYRPRGNDG